MDEVGVDERLIAAAVSVLRSTNPRDGWVEAKVASDIAAQAASGSSPAHVKEIESWRDVVVSVSKADRQVGSLDDAGSVVRRGLMLLVLRCQPERIVRAGETPLRPGPQVTAVAGMLSGLFHGYSRLSRDLKARSCSAKTLSRLALSWWSSVDSQPRRLVVGTSVRREDATTVRVAATVDREVLVERVIRPTDAMMQLYERVKVVGHELEFDPDMRALVCEADVPGGVKRRIVIETGSPTLRGDATIRVRTVCLTRDGSPVRATRREDTLALLERNHDPLTRCRFAVEPATGFVEVLEHRRLEPMDSTELWSLIEAVAITAEEFEAALAERPTAPPRRAATGKKPLAD